MEAFVIVFAKDVKKELESVYGKERLKEISIKCRLEKEVYIRIFFRERWGFLNQEEKDFVIGEVYGRGNWRINVL